MQADIKENRMIETRIIIAGSRDFNDFEKLQKEADSVVRKLDGKVKIISGSASGADRLGEKYANMHGIDIIRFPANWNLYGKSAGPRRNEEMARYASESNGILLAFWDGKSRGTKNMIENARKYRLSVKVVNY